MGYPRSQWQSAFPSAPAGGKARAYSRENPGSVSLTSWQVSSRFGHGSGGILLPRFQGAGDAFKPWRLCGTWLTSTLRESSQQYIRVIIR